MELIRPSKDKNSEYFKIKKEYLEVIKNIAGKNEYLKYVQDFSETEKTPDSTFIGGLPITLERKDIFNIMSKDIKGNYRYSVTQKADGVRVLLFSCYKTESGGRKMCFIDRKNNFYTLKASKREELPTISSKLPKLLIDGELIIYDKNNQTTTDLSTKYYSIKSFSFMAFDILYGPISIDYSGIFDDKRLNIGSEGAMAGPIGGSRWPYFRRYNILNLLIVPNELNDYRALLSNSFKECDWFIPEIKPLIFINSLQIKKTLYSQNGFFQKNLSEFRKEFYDLINLDDYRTKKMEYIPVKLDGLIFTPFNTEYIIGGAWKRYLNIQYKWKPIEEQSIDFLIDYSGKTVVLKMKSGSGYIPFTVKRNIPYPVEPFQKVKSGTIGEFTLVNEKFKLKNIRTDKTEPNSKSTAINVFNSIKKPVNIDIIKMFFIIDKLDNIGIKTLMQYLSKSQLINCSINNNKMNIFNEKNKLSIINNLNEFKKYDNYEYEIRIGYIEQTKFQPNLPLTLYKRIMDILVNNNFKFEYYVLNDYYKDSVRSRYLYLQDLKSETLLNSVIKSKIDNSDIDLKYIYNFDLRFSLSNEKSTDIIVKNNNYSLRIEKKRTSFNLGILQVDCTEIRKFNSDNLTFGPSSYQIELEIADRKAEYLEIKKLITGLLSLIN
mgnify:CR=1 FL=1